LPEVTSDIKVAVAAEPTLRFEDVRDFSEGLAAVMLLGKYGFADKTGAVVIPAEYDGVSDFSDGLARVEKDGLCGYIDKTGAAVVPLEYDDAGEYREGMVWVAKDGLYGYADKSGKLVIGLTYERVVGHFNNPDFRYPSSRCGNFSEGLVAVSADNKCGFIDKTGKLVIPAVYDGEFIEGEWGSYMPYFHEGLARVSKDGLFGYINTAGDTVIPFQYGDAGDYYGLFSHGLAAARNQDGMCGIIDTKGNTVAPFDYFAIFPFNGELAFALKGDAGHGYPGCYINKAGKEVTAYEYDGDQWTDHVYLPSYEGLTVVRKDGAYGCLDARGDVVIPVEYESVSYCSGGLFYVYNRDAGSGIVDKTGKYVISATSGYEVYGFMAGTGEWGQISYVDEEGYIQVYEFASRLDGYIDTAGRLVIPCEYRLTSPFSEGLAGVGIARDGDTAVGYIDRHGKVAVTFEYTESRGAHPFRAGLAWVEKGVYYGILEIVAP
jgi:hypothetical protein